MQSRPGRVKMGTGMASGARACQDIGGTIRAQRPFFQALGLDMAGLHDGTINIDISPLTFDILAPDFVARNVKWHAEWNAETFSFVRCRIGHGGAVYDGWVYFPHPETKPTEFLGRGYIEVLAPPVPGLRYGDEITFFFDPAKLSIG